MTTFFSSDLHFGHKNIIEYCKRPVKDVAHMNEVLVQNWNAVVKPGDQVYILGDFCLGSEELAVSSLQRLNGQKFLIWGNHDKRLRKVPSFTGQFTWCRELDKIEVEGQKIVLCHYALLVWDGSHKGNWMLHGHSHGTLPDDPNALRLDVGVDASWTGFAPVSMSQIRTQMARKTWKSIDHHEKREL